MHKKLYRHNQWHNPMPDSWNNVAQAAPSSCCNANITVSHPCTKIEVKDYGQRPLVINIDQATKHNQNYRTALWTGKYFQVTLMSIRVGEDIGLEVHPTTDQFIRIEEGQGLVQMGDEKDQLHFETMACEDYAVIVPAGKWHNITNTGDIPLKVYVIYAPPEHPYGTVHETKDIAMAAEK